MDNALLHLLQLCDPALPIGGFSHSAGLETYVQAGRIKDKISAEEFIRAMLSNNIQHNDAAFLSLAYDAAANNDLAGIAALDTACTAAKLPEEIRQASIKLCTRLLKIFQPLCKNELMDEYYSGTRSGKTNGHYCIAFALTAIAMDISKQETLTGFYYNAAAGFVTNCVKLIPLSQQSGQEILFSLKPLIAALSERTMYPDEDMLGLCCSGFDIGAMRHERLYSRLYMS
jgi:urease accessory protein